MLTLIAFALGFLGGLTYGRMKVITWLLLLTIVCLMLGLIEISI